MHGLINRSLQCFLRETYGRDAWTAISRDANVGIDNFEALLVYEPDVTQSILKAAAAYTGNPVEMILEDLGTFLVSHPTMEAPRRLLRFGGENFIEFLFSLDELRDRVRMAVPDLIFPSLELRDHFLTSYTLLVSHKEAGFGHVMVGVLRAMADDYGTLAFLEHRGRRDGVETIAVELIDISYSRGREFALAACA